jgi:RimJ/RimL family protein N-acetyltransferase
MNNKSSVNTIETDRLYLRHLTNDVAPFILELLNDPSFIQNIGDRNVRSIPDAEAYILKGPVASYEKNGFGLDLVILKETGESMGICGLIKRDTLDDVDIGYAFLPKFWSKGYAVESAIAVKEYGQKVHGLKRIVAITLPENKGSIRVLERIGLTFEKMIKLDGDNDELMLFAIESNT